MNRPMAIKILQDMLYVESRKSDILHGINNEKRRAALQMAIDALKYAELMEDDLK